MTLQPHLRQLRLGVFDTLFQALDSGGKAALGGLAEDQIAKVFRRFYSSFLRGTPDMLLVLIRS